MSLSDQQETEMADEQFDPYHKWLGIPPGEQPPNYYRLLGIELFESDLEVIESAADQRMAHLRTFQSGKNAKFSQRLLNEVSKARICLLKPESKLAYDESLEVDESEKPDFGSSPPIQVQEPPAIPSTSKSGAKSVIAIVLLIATAGAGYGIMQYGSGDSESGDSKSLAAQKKGGDSNGKQVASKSQADSPNSNKTPSKLDSQAGVSNQSKSNPSTDSQKAAGTSDMNPESETDSKTDLKSQSTTPENSKSRSSDSDQKKKEKAEPKKIQDKPDRPENDDQSEPPKKKNRGPLIIGKSNPNRNRTVVRGPIPPAERWRPYISALKKDYDLKEVMTRDERYSAFQELIRDASEEYRSDRSYAMFNLAMEQAKQLNHSLGAADYCSAFSKRFEYSREKAINVYLKTLVAAVSEKSSIARLLIESQKHIRRMEDDRRFNLAASLLSDLVLLGEKPFGKDINSGHFEMWLAADNHLAQLMKQKDKLVELNEKNQLAPAQHRQLGTLECFVNHDWQAGLQHYTQCDFKPLADVAGKVLEVNVSDLHSISEAADLWWVLSSKVKEEEYLFKSRAAYWYSEYANLVNESEISRKIQKRMEDWSVGIGLKKIQAARSPTRISILDLEKSIPMEVLSNRNHILFPDNQLIAVLFAEQSGDDQDNTLLHIVHTETREVVNRNLNHEGFIDHPVVAFWDRVAWISFQAGIMNYAIGHHVGKSERKSSGNRLTCPEQIRAFDIGDKGNVFALAGKSIYWWNPTQAWGKRTNTKPTQFVSPVSFIPNRLKIIPNSPSIALANTRNLVRVNPVSKGITELHSGGEFNDFDFAANGYALLIAAKDGIRFKATKGGKDLFFKTNEPLKVRFLPNSRFFISLHADNSIRIWDATAKDKDYLIDRLESPDLKPVDFAVSPDGSRLATIDSKSLVKLFNLFYE